MAGSEKRQWSIAGAIAGAGTTLAVVVALGVLAGSGAAAGSAAPANTAPPTVSGTPQAGQKLTGDRGDWSNSPTSYEYRWLRCSKSGDSCSGISGATATTYTLTSSDAGHTIRFRVEARNADGKRTARSAPTSVVSGGPQSAPTNTQPPTISGTPQEGQTLKGDKGKWSGSPGDYNYFWVRCDKSGGSCANISGANGSTYLLRSVDVGNTIRFKVEAKNPGGSTFASSVPTAVIAAATKPPPPPTTAAGCPAGNGAINVASVSPPARLLLDRQETSPSVVTRGTNQLIVRYHVSACGGRSVQGALVYATAVPFAQLTIPAEQPTNSSGWAELNFRMIGFPVSSKQQLIAIFARARKSGESVLGGISTRRLFSVRVNLRG